jgi:proteic killer suppression protein
VIKSFRHAGLKKFFLTGSKAGIQPRHAAILADQLTLLNVVKSPQQMNVPTWGRHQLKGKEAGQYAVWVNRNWRLTFTFEGEDAILVDYRDYH